jgi:hypothetical protein
MSVIRWVANEHDKWETRRIRMNQMIKAFSFVLALGCALGAQTRLSGENAEAARVQAPAYVFGTMGSFVGIQHDFTVNSLWYLSRVEGIAPLLPAVCDSGNAHCYWHTASMVYDVEEAMVFAVLPQKQSSDPEEMPQWQVIAFQMPDMTVAGHFQLPKCEEPELLVRPGHQELFVNYTLPKPAEQPDFETVVDVYDTHTLQKKQSIHEKTNEEKFKMSEVFVNASFSHAEFNRSGDLILSGLSRITFNDKEFHKEVIDPIDALEPAERRKLGPFYRIQPVNKTRWLPRALADFSGGRALIVCESQDGAQMAMWTVNVENSKASAVMVVPAGTAHLIGHGARILVEKTKPMEEHGRIGQK